MHLTAEHPQLHLPACVQGSCGIQVAAYAGLPPSLLQRASQQASRLALSQTQAQAQPIHALNSHTAVEAAAAQPRGCHSSKCVGAGSTGGSSCRWAAGLRPPPGAPALAAHELYTVKAVLGLRALRGGDLGAACDDDRWAPHVWRLWCDFREQDERR